MQPLGFDQARESFRCLAQEIGCLEQLLLNIMQLVFLLREVFVMPPVIGKDAAELVYGLHHLFDLISLTSAISAVAFPCMASAIRSAAAIRSS